MSIWNNVEDPIIAAERDELRKARGEIGRLEKEIGRLRAAFRVNMLRFGGTDAEIDAVLNPQTLVRGE